MSDERKDQINGLLLSKDQILGVDDRPTDYVNVPEWGGHVKIRALSAWELSEYEQSLIEVKVGRNGKSDTSVKMQGHTIRLAAYGIVNENNERIFTEKDLYGKAASAIKRIADAVRAISGMDVTEEEAAGN